MASEEIAVGYQHSHTGMVSALRSIFTEHGLVGLWRGVSGAVARVMVGSSVQLSTFSVCKERVVYSQVKTMPQLTRGALLDSNTVK